jgi:putative ABC transport system permease protein
MGMTLILRTSLERAGDSLAVPLASVAPLQVVGAGPRGSIPPDVVNTVRTTPGVEVAAPVVKAVTILETGRKSQPSRTASSAVKPALAFGIDCQVYRLLAQPDCSQSALDALGVNPAGVGPGIPNDAELRTDTGRVALRDGPVLEHLQKIAKGRVVIFELSEAQRLFARGHNVDVVYVRPGDGVQIEDLRHRLDEALPNQFAVLDTATQLQLRAFLDWQLPFFVIMALFTSAIGALLARNAFRAAIDRQRSQLAVLAALGGSRITLALPTVVQGVGAGIIGGLAGLLLGWVAAYPVLALVSSAQQAATGIPVAPEVRVSAATGALTVLLGVVSALSAVLGPLRRSLHLNVAWELANLQVPAAISPRVRLRQTALTLVIGLSALVGCWLAQRGGGLDEVQVLFGKICFIVTCAALMLAIKQSTPLLTALLGRAGVLLSAPGRLALANLRTYGSRAGEAAVGIASVIVVTIITTSLMNGMSGWADGMEGNWNGLQVARSDPWVARNLDAKLPFAVVERLRELPEVGSLKMTASVLVGHTAEDRTIVLASEDRTATEPIVSGTDDHRLLANGYVLVGTTLARAQGLRTGGLVRLLTPTGAVGLPIAAIVQNPAFGGLNVQMSMALMERLYGAQPPDSVVVTPAAGTNSAALEHAVRSLLARSEIYSDAEVLTPAAARKRLFDWQVTLFAPFQVIRSALLVITFTAVASALLLAGAQRRREVGMLSAIGLLPRQIATMVIAEAALLAFIGIAGGILVGAVMAKALLLVISLMAAITLDYHVGVDGLAGSAALAMFCSLAAAVLPTVRTARLASSAAIPLD